MTALGEIRIQIIRLRQNACEDVVKIGQLLIEAQSLVPHGQWNRWLRDNFTWSQDTAENFIHVAETFGASESETFRNLEVSSLYLLARPSTPPDARETVVELIRDGTPPSLRDVRRIVREAKQNDCDEDDEKQLPTPKQAALVEQFKTNVTSLLELTTKPVGIFANFVSGDDLNMLSNFLRQIADASRKAA